MDELIKKNYQLVMLKILKYLSLCELQLYANDAYFRSSSDQFSLSDLGVIFVLYDELDCRYVVTSAIK